MDYLEHKLGGGKGIYFDITQLNLKNNSSKMIEKSLNSLLNQTSLTLCTTILLMIQLTLEKSKFKTSKKVLI
jgi:hypothetical protein